MGTQSVFVASMVLVLMACSQNSDPKTNPITPPSTLPPDGFIGNEWIDSRGCHYLKINNPSGGVDWVASVTIKGSHICDGEPISGGKPNVTASATQSNPKPQIKADKTAGAAAANSASSISSTPANPNSTPLVINSNSGDPQIRNDDQFFQGKHWMQVGAFSILSNAEKTVERLKSFQYEAVIYYGERLNIVYVRARDGQSAEQFEKEIKAIGYDGFFVSGGP